MLRKKVSIPGESCMRIHHDQHVPRLYKSCEIAQRCLCALYLRSMPWVGTSPCAPVARGYDGPESGISHACMPGQRETLTDVGRREALACQLILRFEQRSEHC